MQKLTIKQENFCQAYIKTGNASEAYRQAYNTSKMKEATVNNNAHKLLKNNEITTRIEKIKNDNLARNNITVDSLIAELEEARISALAAQTPQNTAAIAATMGKAKLLGLDKQIIDNISSDGSMSPKPTKITLVGVRAEKQKD